MTQSIEEAWAALRLAQVHEGPALRGRETDRTARALALAAFDAGVVASGSVGKISEQIERQRKRRKDIEELGR